MIYPILGGGHPHLGTVALAFDLVFGYAGLLSFGHAMFWARADT